MDPILKIEEERARFEADAVPYGFDIARSKNLTGEPWCEYRELEAGHRWGGWLASAELAAQTLASKEAELAEAGLKYVSLFGELQNAMAQTARLLEALHGKNGALTRMDRARELLSNGSNWLMLDTSDIRAALTQPTE